MLAPCHHCHSIQIWYLTLMWVIAMVFCGSITSSICIDGKTCKLWLLYSNYNMFVYSLPEQHQVEDFSQCCSRSSLANSQVDPQTQRRFAYLIGVVGWKRGKSHKSMVETCPSISRYWWPGGTTHLDRVEKVYNQGLQTYELGPGIKGRSMIITTKLYYNARLLAHICTNS